MEWTTVAQVNQAIDEYGKSLQKLKNFQNDANNFLPKGAITVGTIGEYYCYIWLKHQFPSCKVHYGDSTQKSWDIEVISNEGQSTKYQCKTVSLNSTNLTISNLKKGFDKLIIIVLSEDYFPEVAYELTNDFEFRDISSFAIKDPRKPNSGSPKLKSVTKEINFEFFDSLADRLC